MNTGLTYDTLSQAVTDLQSRGYNYDFSFEEGCLSCQKLEQNFKPADLKITGVFRFEGMTNPDDSSVLYAIESHNGHKGLLIDAYGVYADEQKTAFIGSIPAADGN